ncbi:MAG: nitrogen regulation protein NR(II) [Candidatus Scalinduaceae bacterium]
MSSTALINKGSIKATEQEIELLKAQIKDSNDKLRETKSELSLIKMYHENVMNNVQSGILIFDKNLKVAASNSYFNKLLESQNGTSSLRLFRLYSKFEKICLYDELKEVIAKGKIWTVEKVEFNAPSGKSYKLNIRSSPILNTNNFVIGGCLIVEDTTKRLELEDELSASERFAVCGKQSIKVVHELNNLLDGILRFINLSVRLSNGNNKLKNYLLQSKNGLGKMVDIVSSLLNFSRATYADKEMIPINNIIKDAVAFLDHKTLSNKIKISFNTDKQDSCTNNGDLIRVLINIMNNSIDAMLDGGELKITSKLRKGRNIISVSDTGVGIPPSAQKRIFDPFFTNKRKGVGMGLGLAICEEIIKKMGGNISVDSKEGKGTTFTVSIPVE